MRRKKIIRPTFFFYCIGLGVLPYEIDNMNLDKAHTILKSVRHHVPNCNVARIRHNNLLWILEHREYFPDLYIRERIRHWCLYCLIIRDTGKAPDQPIFDKLNIDNNMFTLYHHLVMNEYQGDINELFR